MNLQLLKGETTAGTDTTIVLDGGASDDGAKEVDGTGSNGGGLGDTGLATTKFTTGLVEVCPHATLPLLAEVVVGELLRTDFVSG
jgi:hypothetical protein